MHFAPQRALLSRVHETTRESTRFAHVPQASLPVALLPSLRSQPTVVTLLSRFGRRIRRTFLGRHLRNGLALRSLAAQRLLRRHDSRTLSLRFVHESGNRAFRIVRNESLYSLQPDEGRKLKAEETSSAV